MPMYRLHGNQQPNNFEETMLLAAKLSVLEPDLLMDAGKYFFKATDICYPTFNRGTRVLIPCGREFFAVKGTRKDAYPAYHY
jgi:hypothetical protein